MMDISFGEFAVLAGIGIVLVGRKDLPYASHALGRQVGRVVGLLQGARMRADRFATDHQLKQLQNEFKSGLRELDAVKAELAGAMTNTRSFGGNLGATVPGVDRRRAVPEKPPVRSAPPVGVPHQQQNIGAEYLVAAQQAEGSQSDMNHMMEGPTSLHYDLAPRSQAVKAVAEEEWEKRGISFQSIAERGSFAPDDQPHTRGASTNVGGGATILSNFLRQSLIHDQYERTIREQDEALRSRVDKVRNERESLADEDSSKER